VNGVTSVSLGWERTHILLNSLAVGIDAVAGVGVGVTLDVVVAVDVVGEVLVVFVIPPVHPATNTVANTIITINMIKNCFFIVIPSFRIFPVVRGYPQK